MEAEAEQSRAKVSVCGALIAYREDDGRWTETEREVREAGDGDAADGLGAQR